MVRITSATAQVLTTLTRGLFSSPCGTDSERPPLCDPAVPGDDEEMEVGELASKRLKTGLTFCLPRRTEPSMTEDLGRAIDLCDGSQQPFEKGRRKETKRMVWNLETILVTARFGGNDID